MLLLDTHAILWLDNGDPLSAAAHQAIRQAAPAGGVLVSPVSAWEIGLLVSKGRLALDLAPVAWFQRFLGVAGVRLAPFTIEIAAGCWFLPLTAPRRSGRTDAGRDRAEMRCCPGHARPPDPRLRRVRRDQHDSR